MTPEYEPDYVEDLPCPFAEPLAEDDDNEAHIWRNAGIAPDGTTFERCELCGQATESHPVGIKAALEMIQRSLDEPILRLNRPSPVQTERALMSNALRALR